MSETDNTNGKEIPEKQVDVINAVSNLLTNNSTLFDGLIQTAVNQAPVIKRRQYASYGIIAVIVFMVSALAYTDAIHGSAAASILGAIAGHIFSNANRQG